MCVAGRAQLLPPRRAGAAAMHLFGKSKKKKEEEAKEEGPHAAITKLKGELELIEKRKQFIEMKVQKVRLGLPVFGEARCSAPRARRRAVAAAARARRRCQPVCWATAKKKRCAHSRHRARTHAHTFGSRRWKRPRNS